MPVPALGPPRVPGPVRGEAAAPGPPPPTRPTGLKFSRSGRWVTRTAAPQVADRRSHRPAAPRSAPREAIGDVGLIPSRCPETRAGCSRPRPRPRPLRALRPMAAADPAPPPEEEEEALLEPGKAAPPGEDPPAAGDPRGDPDATLLWDRRQRSARGRPEPTESKRRSSPEGGREDPEEGNPACPPPEADGEEDPGLPMMAAHVFVPIDLHCIERTPTEQRKQQPSPQPPEESRGGRVLPRDGPGGVLPKQTFLPADPSRYRGPLSFEGPAAKLPPEGPRRPCAGLCSTAALKAVASLVGALLLCPCLLYGAYVFLPFDAPLLPTVSSRLLYALRCAAFATVPIVLGMIVSGISRLCSAALEPFGKLQREVEIHQTFVSQSVHLFILYFFNMAVLATYLQQELLKLIPLLTGLFAISRLTYWLSYAFGRSFRAFGFAMTFLPLLAMLLWNLYSMFVLEPDNLLALATEKPEESSRHSRARLRYWG
ncbi:transmembrane protein 79 [Excalfactoria chinensis]|uniref:transmembrane protein 79 n=1 Tax=Excalfactoria chinensis TaxID=46218 RepID=UPI003B3A3CEF